MLVLDRYIIHLEGPVVSRLFLRNIVSQSNLNVSLNYSAEAAAGTPAPLELSQTEGSNHNPIN